MNPKYRRLFITVIIVLTLGLATKLILMALEDNIVYFYTPNDLLEKFGNTQNIQNKIRIGGLVLESSVKKERNKIIFMINTTPASRMGEVAAITKPKLADISIDVVTQGTIKPRVKI